jgi:hypothetical protein
MFESFIGTISLVFAVGAWAYIRLVPDTISSRDERYIRPERKGVKK